MADVLYDQQRFVEEDLLSFCLAHIMLFDALRLLPSSHSNPSICGRSSMLYITIIYNDGKGPEAIEGPRAGLRWPRCAIDMNKPNYGLVKARTG
jgi:hypothetical protein